MPATPDQNDRIIKLLVRSFNAELETVMNYLANATNLDGVRAKQIKDSLLSDVTAELGHAQLLAGRIKTIGGVVPGSQELKWSQDGLQPPNDTTDVVKVIKGVIEAEEDAISGYAELIQVCEGVDYVTQDLAITLMADEQEHRREFVGFLREYEKA
jgi:bacterioferritin